MATVATFLGTGYLAARSGVSPSDAAALGLNAGAFVLGAVNFGAVEDLPKTRYGQAGVVAAGTISGGVGGAQTLATAEPAAVLAVPAFTAGAFTGKGLRRVARAARQRGGGGTSPPNQAGSGHSH